MCRSININIIADVIVSVRSAKYTVNIHIREGHRDEETRTYIHKEQHRADRE